MNVGDFRQDEWEGSFVLMVLSSDQEFFRQTTAKFLGDQVPVEVLRRLRDDAAGFDGDYWRRGVELGWTSFLVGEEHGGGSISGDGVADATIIAQQFGIHAAPGPLVPVNVVAAALSDTGSHPEVLTQLLEGSAIATWCVSERNDGRSIIGDSLEIKVDGDELVLNGIKRPVESAGQADHLLVTGRSTGGLTQVLVPSATPGVTITPMTTVDLTRRFSTVDFNEVRVPSAAVVGVVDRAAADVERQLQLALVLLNAESVGAMRRAFDITVEWAFDRFSFGRPLASYQAIKHRFADMKSWLEAGQAIADAGAEAVAARAATAPSVVSAAKAFIGDYGGELLQECVQLHGGLGLTFEHDVHLYLRRQTVNRALYGTPAAHRRRLTDLDERQESV